MTVVYLPGVTPKARATRVDNPRLAEEFRISSLDPLDPAKGLAVGIILAGVFWIACGLGLLAVLGGGR